MKISNKLKSVGLKVTPQRRVVYEVMQKICHGSIDEIIGIVRSQNPDITISTIYRIMDSFCQAGLLSKFVGNNGKVIYDITVKEHHHIFTSGEEIIDIEDEWLSEIIREHVLLKIPENEAIDRISVYISTKNKENGKEKIDIDKRSSDSG
ncbi:Fur family transcriptional regulator [Coprobacter tertius]|uniref:Transcriptional repressor n=1 Tax=Coprobacter tertius TaxID=2944915 RepID=A0ABT1MN58_9BACT|nr:transcriptional repressor [Coprobacter tertius]MCP9612726.1 transcriptional repressor [Coprobacter tertius]